MRRRTWTIGTCLLCVVCAVVSSSASAQERELSPTEFFEVAGAMRELLPLERIDLSRCARSVGPGWEGAWKLVRDGIRYVPYEGSFRGPLGTLLCGEGNSLDQALLLAALMETKGYRSRLCHAELPASQRLEIGQLRPPQEPSRLEDLARVTGLAVDDLRRFEAAARERSRLATGFLLGRAEARVRQLETTLGDSPAAEAPSKEATHFWLQVETAPDLWKDLDPSAALEPAQTVAEPTATFAVSELPETWQAKVSLRVRLDDKELLTLDSTAADLAWRAVSLAFIPADAAFPRSFEKSPQAILDAYQKVERFQPVLAVDAEFRMGRSFDLDGNVFERIADWRLEAAQGVGRGLGGLFGGGRKEPEKKFEPWRIVYELTVTGPEGTRTAVRELVAKGPREAMRLRLLSGVTFLPIPGAVSPDAVALRRLDHLLRNREVLEVAASGDFSAGKDWNRVSQEPLGLLAFAQAETAFFQQLSERDRAFLPFHVVAWERRSDVGDTGPPSTRTLEGIDILFAPIGTSLSGKARTALGIRWGVILTEIERRILDALGARDVQNAGRAFFLASATDTPLDVLREASAVESRTLPRTFQETLLSELAAGRWVVVPRGPVRSRGGELWAYFSIDPKTGETLGRSTGGRGQSLTEYAEGVDIFMSAAGTLQSFADFMKCLVGTIAMPLAGATQAQMRVEFCKCSIQWAYGAFTGGIKGFFDIDPSFGAIAVDIGLGGMPGTDFGGFNGAIGKSIAANACGAGS